jgi:hypothetical protein
MISQSNPLAAYYYNPLAQGLVSSTGTGSTTGNAAAFGTPLFGTSTGSSGSYGSRNTGSAFGGASTTGSSFGGIGSTTGRTGSTGLSGTASISGRTTTGTIAPNFAGGTWGPSIGRRGVVTGATLRRPAPGIPIAARRPDLQAIIGRSTSFTGPANVTVTTDGTAVVLTGTVASEDDRRIAENMLRLAPGVHDLRNNLTVQPSVGPAAPAPFAGTSPGPAPIAPPP